MSEKKSGWSDFPAEDEKEPLRLYDNKSVVSLMRTIAATPVADPQDRLRATHIANHLS